MADESMDSGMGRIVDRDVAALGRIDAVETILRVMQRVTNLRTSLVARVTSDSWTACAVLDEAGYGLKPGDNLELHTTF